MVSDYKATKPEQRLVVWIVMPINYLMHDNDLLKCNWCR